MDKDARIRELEAQVASLLETVRMLAKTQGTTQVGVPLEKLTTKQAASLAMCVEGMTYAQVAEECDLSESTIKIMMRMAFHKLGVRNLKEFNMVLRDRAKVMIEAGVLERTVGIPTGFGRNPKAYPDILRMMGEKKHVD